MPAEPGGAYPDDVLGAARFILTRISEPPRLAIILGSGIASAAEEWEIHERIPYAAIPSFPVSAVEGHAGNLLAARVGPLPALVMSGRSHFYETGAMRDLAFAVRTLCACGAGTLILTNSAGGLRSDLTPGRLMLVTDHIALPVLGGFNPLTGPNVGPGPRFPSMTRAYDPALLEEAERAARELGIECASGVYAMVAGPSYETAAEVEFLRRNGVSAVGMSLAPETIVARHCGARVLALSVISNLALAASEEPDHAQVLSVARRSAADVGRLIAEVARGLRELL